LPVPKFDTGASTIVEQNPIDMKGTSSISRKLQEIRIPQLSLSEETVREAIEKLQKKSRQLDTTETDPSKKGVNIVLKLDPAKEADGGTKITLSLNDLPLGEALKYVASAANLKVKIEPYAVAIVPLSEPTETLISKEYKVPPGFISSAAGGGSSGGGIPTAGNAGTPGTVGKSGAKEFLESQGVTFPAGSSATYLASSSKLLVKNSQSNLDLIDSLVEVSLATPPVRWRSRPDSLKSHRTICRNLALTGSWVPSISGAEPATTAVAELLATSRANPYPASPS
jgi:general secretion pathway protein D